jgi:mRNA-degrading endonuclease YafQ of YafQ-DinJ toxin-antitoxin module
MAAEGWPEMPAQQAARVNYVIKFLQTGSRKDARKDSGIKSTKTHNSIIQMLQRHGSLAEAGHHREPTKFTEEVFLAAKEYLIDNNDTPLTAKDVVAHLLEEGLLQPPTNEHNFLAAFGSWVAAQDCHLQVGARSLVFQITEGDAAKRLLWVQQLRRQLRKEFKLEDMIFVDETQFEEGPHPKGRTVPWAPPSRTATHSHTEVMQAA